MSFPDTQNESPQFRQKWLSRLGNLIVASPLLVAAGSLVALAVLAPYWEHNMDAARSEPAYRALRSICHQVPSRCIWIFGSNMGLCSRCFGLYLGVATGAVWACLCTRFRPRVWVSLLLIVPLFADVLLGKVVGGANIRRFATGLLAGTGFGLIVTRFYLQVVFAFCRLGRKLLSRKEVKQQTEVATTEGILDR